MGRIAKLLSFVRTTKNSANVSDVKVVTDGGINTTAEHLAPAGDDSHPLPGDYVALNPDSGTGRESAIGYLDPLNDSKALAGEKRIYARSGDGAAIVELWLKNTGEAALVNDNATVTLYDDGAIKADNGSGSFELKANGDFFVNGVTIDTNGNITTPGNVNANDVTADNESVTLSTHHTPAFNVPPTAGT